MLRISGLPAGSKEADLHDFFRHCNIKIKILKFTSETGVAEVEVEHHDPLDIVDDLRKKKFKGQYSLEFIPHPVDGAGNSSYGGTDPSEHQPESKKDPGSSTSGTTTRNDR